MKVLKRSTGPQAAVRELLGESALWWHCCGEAVRDDPQWLTSRDCEELRIWLAANVPDAEHAAASRVDHPLLLARALVAAERGSQEQDAGLLRVLDAWEGGHLLCAEAAPGPAQPSGKRLTELSPRVAGDIDALLQRSHQLCEDAEGERSSAAEGLLVIAALMLGGVAPRTRPTIRLPVVFGRVSGSGGGVAAAEGVTGTLELREFPPGPEGLFPDPRTMDGVRSPNSQFAAALGEAWRLAGPRREGRCVLWRLVLSDEAAAPDRIEGPSLGAAFALGLRALLRYPSSRRPGTAWFRDVFHGLRPRTAVTGALDADGRLLRVAEMDAKLLAARRKNFRLVAPEANRLTVAAAPRPGDVRFASDLREADRYARQFRLGRLAVVALVLAGLTVGGLALHQRDLARDREQSVLAGQATARADQLRADDPSLAARLDVEAYRLRPTSDLYARLIEDANKPLSTVVNDFSGSVHAVAFSPDGHTLAAVGYDDGSKGMLRIWSTADSAQPVLLGRPVRLLHNVGSVVFSPDGHTLVTSGVGTADTVQLWDVTDPARPRTLGTALPHTPSGNPVRFSHDGRILATGSSSVNDEQLWNITDPSRPVPLGRPLHHSSAVNVVAFSPDGRTLATSSVEDGARLWNIADPAHAVPLGHIGSAVSSMVFSPDHRTLVMGDTGNVRLMNVTDPAHAAMVSGTPLTGFTGSVRSIAFSPDGRILAVAADQNMRLWNLANPERPAPLGPSLDGHTATISSVAFAPDGHTIATSSRDHTVRLWRLPTALLTDHADAISSMLFSSDGRMLATADGHTVRLWNTTDPTHPTPVGRLRASDSTVSAMALSPDGRTLVTTAYDDKLVTLWNLSKPAQPTAVVQITNFSAGVNSVAFSPDGLTLATTTATGVVGGDNSVRLWDMSEPTRPRLRGQPLAGEAGAWSTALFSPDGHTMAVAGRYSGYTAQLWDVSDPDRPLRSGPPLTGGAGAMAFSPDGRTLATVTVTGVADGPGDGTVRLWNISDHDHPSPIGQPLTGSNGPIRTVAFSPDGHTLATAGNLARLWDVTDLAMPAAIGQPLAVNSAELTSLAFTPDGNTLATAGQDNTARLWPLEVDQSVQQICANTDPLNRRQWQQYLPSLPYRATCD
ncbi:hypothetical protein [Streptomyces sp. NPDC003247]|uniref:hypothetical protein n=1 Tax=Streptomyces sp. NPDC003247 TaxID=3364677 RepID=UPI0036A199C7